MFCQQYSSALLYFVDVGEGYHCAPVIRSGSVKITVNGKRETRLPAQGGAVIEFLLSDVSPEQLSFHVFYGARREGRAAVDEMECVNVQTQNESTPHSYRVQCHSTRGYGHDMVRLSR
jgi:hypothetical protein